MRVFENEVGESSVDEDDTVMKQNERTGNTKHALSNNEKNSLWMNF